MDSAVGSREPSAQATEAAESAVNPTNSSGTAGSAKTSRPRAKFNNSDDLPDENAELTEEEIKKLIYQKPTIRKKYERYFKSRGQIRTEYFHLIFERHSTGELRHPEAIITSNVLHWENNLRHFEEPNKYDAKGREKEPKATSRASTEESPKKRKRASSKASAQQQMSDAPDNDEIGDSHAEKEGAGPTTSDEAASTHDLNAPSTTADEPVVPPSPVSTEVASPEHTEYYPSTGDENLSSSPIPEPEDVQMDYGREHERGSVFNDVFPPAQDQAHFTSSPTVLGIEHTADREACDELMTGVEQNDPTGDAVQIAKEALMDLANSGRTQPERHLSADLGQFVSNFGTGNFNLVDADDLSHFTEWINREIHNLSLNSIQAPVGKNQQYKQCVNDLMVRLLTLQNACFNLEEHLRKDQAGEQ